MFIKSRLQSSPEILRCFLRSLTFLGMPAYNQMKEVEKRALFVDRKKRIMIDRSKIAPENRFPGIILLIRKKGNVNKRRV